MTTISYSITIGYSVQSKSSEDYVLEQIEDWLEEHDTLEGLQFSNGETPIVTAVFRENTD